MEPHESKEELRRIGNKPGLMEYLLLEKHAVWQENRIVPVVTSGEQSTMTSIININFSKGRGGICPLPSPFSFFSSSPLLLFLLKAIGGI
jgi:hypothetical protein